MTIEELKNLISCYVVKDGWFDADRFSAIHGGGTLVEWYQGPGKSACEQFQRHTQQEMLAGYGANSFATSVKWETVPFVSSMHNVYREWDDSKWRVELLHAALVIPFIMWCAPELQADRLGVVKHGIKPCADWYELKNKSWEANKAMCAAIEAVNPDMDDNPLFTLIRQESLIARKAIKGDNRPGCIDYDFATCWLLERTIKVYDTNTKLILAKVPKKERIKILEQI